VLPRKHHQFSTKQQRHRQHKLQHPADTT
jgi:hypothetical protein